MSWITENTLINLLWKWTKRICFIVGAGVLVSIVAILLAPELLPSGSPDPIVPPMLKEELAHRVEVCNRAIDNMSPQYSDAAFQCGMMWVQFQKIEAYMKSKRINHPDQETHELMMLAFRTAARYAEYQNFLNRPRFHPSPDEE